MWSKEIARHISQSQTETNIWDAQIAHLGASSPSLFSTGDWTQEPHVWRGRHSAAEWHHQPKKRGSFKLYWSKTKHDTPGDMNMYSWKHLRAEGQMAAECRYARMSSQEVVYIWGNFLLTAMRTFKLRGNWERGCLLTRAKPTEIEQCSKLMRWEAGRHSHTWRKL